MMNMDGGEPPGQPKPTHNVAQDDRVAATGKGDAKALMRRQAGGQNSADPLAKIS